MRAAFSYVLALAFAVAPAPAQTARPAPAPSREDVLRGAYGPHRANNDLL